VSANDRACPRLPPLDFHGKEGVSGSSLEEGSAKGPEIPGTLAQPNLRRLECAVGMEPSMEPSGREVSPLGAKRRHSLAVGVARRPRAQHDSEAPAASPAQGGAPGTCAFARWQRAAG
jgi:hypothetical protein